MSDCIIVDVDGLSAGLDLAGVGPVVALGWLVWPVPPARGAAL